jgi:RNA polymerase sigma factor (sigma-70 family)
MTSGLATGTTLRHLSELFGGGTAVGLSDAQLLARYAGSRDEPAFAALVARHGPMVLATCRAVLHREHDIEDAFQAAFLVLARKAGSIRAGAALGGWLHRVAYRIAVQASREAKRRRRESEMLAMAPPVPTHPRPEAQLELHSLVHEEIERLPERHRLPMVLCDLEGLTYEQAAARLRWTVPALRCRLARARQRLRERLTRRGVTGAAPGVMAAAASPVPAAWARAAVAAATGGTTSAAALALSRVIIRGMLMTQLKLATSAGLAVLAVATVGILVVGAGRPEPPMPPMRGPIIAEDARPPVAKDDAPDPELEPGARVAVRGRVVGPDGRPVAGATLRTAFVNPEDGPGPEASSGPDGRFRMAIPRPSRSTIMVGAGETFPWLVASAPGFGPGWIPGALKAAAAGERTVRLVEDGPPIEGRIVALEGRPVVGARVTVDRIWYVKTGRDPYAETGDLAAWIAMVKDRGIRGSWDGLSHVPTRIAATATDSDGRFRLAGIGRGRVAELLVSGPAIATTLLYAMSWNGPEAHIHRPNSAPKLLVFHAPRFEYAAAPSQPIAGVVRDKDTGRPLAGVAIKGAVYEERSLAWAPGVEATTDSQGRYRLTGLGKGAAYRLFVEPGAGQPYPKATFRAEAGSPGLEPVAFDIALKRGILVRGRVTDKATGRPVPGYVTASAFRDNPHIGEFPGYRESYPPHVALADDGRYELVALPGRSVIACSSDRRRYRIGIGAEAIPGYDRMFMGFDTLPRHLSSLNAHVLAELDLDPRAESVTLDLQVDPGRTVTVTAVAPDGQPLAGTTASGLSDDSSSTEHPQDSPRFQVHALDPSRPRRVTITHPGRKLIGSVYLKGDEAGPLTVRLQPWATLAGRIVDDEGKPRGRLELHGLGFFSTGSILPVRLDEQGLLPEDVRIGRDGRFRIEGLVPGLKYGASAAEGVMFQGDVFRDVTVAPGEAKDLGDLKVVRPRRDGSR